MASVTNALVAKMKQLRKKMKHDNSTIRQFNNSKFSSVSFSVSSSKMKQNHTKMMIDEIDKLVGAMCFAPH